MLVALRSLSLKPISFGYKTGVPLPHPTPFGGSSPNLELALTSLDTKEGTRSVSLSRRQGSILPPAAASQIHIHRLPQIERTPDGRTVAMCGGVVAGGG